MNRIKLSQYAKLNGISYITAYRYFNKGMLNGIKLSNGTILINIEEQSYLNKNRVILYTRVSSSENKDNLISQMDRIRNYSINNGYIIIDEINEIGSGLNDNRKKLNSIFNRTDFDYIVVEHKDRLTRFGFNYIKILLNKLDKDIIVINNVNNNKEDIIQDFVSIITSYCSKIYGLRRSKRKTKELLEEISKK